MKRALARQKVDFNAKLIFVDAARALDCNVVDMTLDGARLELFAALELPEQIYLWERRTNPIFECNVIGACRDALVCGSRIAAAEACASPSPVVTFFRIRSWLGDSALSVRTQDNVTAISRPMAYAIIPLISASPSEIT